MMPNMRIQTAAVLLLVLALVAGCQGIAPTSRRALDVAETEMQLVRDADERDRRALLVELRETLMDWAADLVDAELRQAADGGLTLKKAQVVLDKYRGRQASAQKKVEQMADPLRVGSVVLYDDRPAVKMFSIRPGWPRSSTGWNPPIARTMTVMTSAIRVMGRRHSAWERRRMAEIRVPA